MPIRPKLVPALAFLLSFAASAQTLARPGWAGSGLSVEPWWTHAVLYELDPHHFSAEGLKGTSRQLDYIHSLGVDAIALAHVFPEASTQQQAVDPVVGTLDDFDDLVREGSRSGIRVLVELDPSSTPDLEKSARFWLGHGVAGISLRPGSASADQVRALREVMKSFAGQRMLIVQGETVTASGELALVPVPLSSEKGGMGAAALRPLLTRLSAAKGARPFVLIDGASANTPEAGKALAALLLATQSNAQLRAGQEIGTAADVAMPWGDSAKPSKAGTVEVAAEEADPDSPLNWVRRLIDLHHGNGVMRSGSIDFLDHDAQNSLVWVMRKPQITPLAPALVVACNLSDKPVTLSLTDDLRGLHLRGSFLRTLARSDKGLGGVGLNAVTLPPFGVYIGELRF